MSMIGDDRTGVQTETEKRIRVHRGREYSISDAHPACDALPWMSDDELSALAADIRDHGQRIPIRRLPDGRLVDGRHRELACRIAGIEPWYEATRPTESEIPGLVASLNLHRRHLTPEERQQWVVHLRQQGHSLRAIAGMVGVDQRTVQRDLSTAANAAVDLPDRVMSLDGRSRPATRPTPAANEPDDQGEPDGATDDTDLDEPAPVRRSRSRSYRPDPYQGLHTQLQGILRAVDLLESRLMGVAREWPYLWADISRELRDRGIEVDTGADLSTAGVAVLDEIRAAVADAAHADRGRA